MSIWMLLVFAVNCLMGVWAFGPYEAGSSLPLQLFVATSFAFLMGVLTRGIRRPVT